MSIKREPNKLKAQVIKGSIGLFIDPDGLCFAVEQSHSGAVISDPGLFGSTSDEIKAFYAKRR